MKFVNILLFLSLLGNELNACWCVGYEIEKLIFEDFDEIFEGKIVAIEKFNYPLNEGYVLDGVEITFEVSKKWKGTPKSKLHIYQEISTCYYNFSINDKWIILSSLGDLTYFYDADNKKYLSKNVLLTDQCFPIFKKSDKDFKRIEKRLNNFFPNEIQLKNEQSYLQRFIITTCITTALILGFIFREIKVKKIKNNR